MDYLLKSDLELYIWFKIGETWNELDKDIDPYVTNEPDTCKKKDRNTFFFITYSKHRRKLSVLHYHKIIVIYPYAFLVVINQLFSCIICINDCICILIGSTGYYFLMIVYVIQKNQG